MEDETVTTVAIRMAQRQLPMQFVLMVAQLAELDAGMRKLLVMWLEAGDDDERREIEADLGELVSDHAPIAPGDRNTLQGWASHELDKRTQFKAHLRSLVDSNGGVSAVARAAGMPQPSLSRLLNSTSEPRIATLKRLADAMGVPVADLEPQSARAALITTIIGGAPHDSLFEAEYLFLAGAQFIAGASLVTVTRRGAKAKPDERVAEPPQLFRKQEALA